VQQFDPVATKAGTRWHGQDEDIAEGVDISLLFEKTRRLVASAATVADIYFPGMKDDIVGLCLKGPITN
jgi:hypothetical protein